MSVMLKIVSEYCQDLWNFLLYILGRITDGTGITEGPGEDCRTGLASGNGPYQGQTNLQVRKAERKMVLLFLGQVVAIPLHLPNMV